MKIKKILLTGLVIVAAGSIVALALTFFRDTHHKPPEIKAGDEFALGTAGLPAILKLEDGEKKHTFESPAFEANFEFNAIAPHWEEVPGDEGYEDLRKIQLRVSADQENWSDWIDVHVDGPLRDDDPHPNKIFAEAPIFIEGKYFQYKLDIQRPSPNGKPPEISNLVLTYIDSRAQPKESLTSGLKNVFSGTVLANQEQGPPIVSRANWGSPDPYGTAFRDGGGLDWRPSYEPVKQIFVHHTVNSNNSSDYSAVVRGIWQYHTYTRGWGDIGYNYLIDGNGTIYEGRFGGDNVVGGHVFGFNRGSMGVGLIGCFQPNNTTCKNLNGGNTGPSSAMLTGLYNLLGWKAKGYEIDPQASHTFCGSSGVNFECRNFFTISGHRDADGTACPGDYIYSILPTIRAEAAGRKAHSFPYSAKQLSFNTTTTSAGKANVTLQFKNTGSATWSNTSPKLYLQTANPDDHASSFRGTGWVTGHHAALLSESSVAPGEIGTFTFNISSAGKAPETYYEGFRLVVEGITNLRSYFIAPIRVPTYRWAYEGQEAFSDAARTKRFTSVPTVVPGGKIYVRVKARNIGDQTWKQSSLRLGTSRPIDRPSGFAEASWLSPSRPAQMMENTIAPGQIATFEFAMQAPTTTGTYNEYFNLLDEGNIWLNDPGLYFTVNVNHAASPSNSIDTSMPSGDVLTKNDYAMSPDSQSVLTLQSDGNLALYSNFGIVWSTGILGSANKLIMQPDGNLVLYDTNNKPLWNTETQGNPGAWLALQTDGNMVVYSSSNTPLWATSTIHNPNHLSYVNTTMPTGRLYPGQFIQTADRRFRLILQRDGNLVLYSPNRPTWATGTDGKTVSFLAMQGDGNLVLYDPSGTPLWYSKTNGYNNLRLVIQQDGNLVLYDRFNIPRWHTFTHGVM